MEHGLQDSTGNLSRRNFIVTTGLAVVAGGVLAGGALASTPKEAPPVATPPAGSWPWVELDPQEAAERAFRNYHAKGG